MSQKCKILLVGRTGNGKSSTGNTILGTTVFKVHGANDANESQNISYHSKEIDGKCIHVVDGTGIGENRDDANIDLSLIPSLERIVFKDDPQEIITAIILVLKFGVRFTKQERDSVETVKLLFGDDVFRKCGVIVMTYGDNFKEGQGETFQSWCERQSGDFKALYEECGGRCVLFNNRDKSRAQVDELLKTIENSELQSYTHDDFNKIQIERFVKIVEQNIQTGKVRKEEVKGLHKKKRKKEAKDLLEDLKKIKLSLDEFNMLETQKKTKLSDDLIALMIAVEKETHRHKKWNKYIKKKDNLKDLKP